MAKRIEDITLDDALPYDTIFPGFEVLSPSPEILGKLDNGLKFPNTLGLVPSKKYLVRSGAKYTSLIEERAGTVRICANSIE